MGDKFSGSVFPSLKKSEVSHLRAVPILVEIHKPKFAFVFHGKPKQEKLMSPSDPEHWEIQFLYNLA